MSSWTSEFESLMQDEGIEPYSCITDNCNHKAKGTISFIVHGKFGKHHMNYENSYTENK